MKTEVQGERPWDITSVCLSLSYTLYLLRTLEQDRDKDVVEGHLQRRKGRGQERWSSQVEVQLTREGFREQ